jgi:hypothetical protein
MIIAVFGSGARSFSGLKVVQSGRRDGIALFDSYVNLFACLLKQAT